MKPNPMLPICLLHEQHQILSHHQSTASQKVQNPTVPPACVQFGLRPCSEEGKQQSDKC